MEVGLGPAGVLGLVGNKTSVSNIEIGSSISFVSAERMHKIKNEVIIMTPYLLSSEGLSDTKVFE